MLARKPGAGADKGKGGRGKGRAPRKSRPGGDGSASSPAEVVRADGETVYVYEMSYESDQDPADVDDPYALMPGGGDQAAADLLAQAGALTMGDDQKGARKCYEAILARFPNHYIANYNMGVDWRLAGKPRSAIKHFTRAIMVWPENHLGYAGMGRTLLDMKQYDAALKMFDKAMEIQPGDTNVINDRKKALVALGRRGRG